MKMQPTIAGESWSDLAAAVIRLDDGDVYLGHLPYALEEAQDPADAALLRAILRVQAELLRSAADRVRPDRGLRPPDPEQLQDEACERLVQLLAAGFDQWSASAWFHTLTAEDRATATGLGTKLSAISARVARNHAVVRAEVLAMMRSAGAAV
jgi:hypothetical protein